MKNDAKDDAEALVGVTGRFDVVVLMSLNWGGWRYI